MLKNIAIPLMLAATEAEAQPSLEDRIEEAMRQDRDKFFDGLKAGEQDGQDCQRDNANDEKISAAVGLVTEAEKKIVAEKEKIKDLLDNDWKTANEERAAAVKAAVDAEVDQAVADLLDELDGTMDATRTKAKEYQEAYVAKVRADKELAALETAKDDAAKMKKDLDDAKKEADDALEAATKQLAREQKHRQWLYCELGTTDNVAEPAKNWWSIQTDSGSGVDEAARAADTQPVKCIVPAIEDPDNNFAIDRPAVEYWSAKGSNADTQLEAELKPHDGNNPWKLWNAQVKYMEVAGANTATKDVDGTPRTPAGEAWYYVHKFIWNGWLLEQRKREDAFYTMVTEIRDEAAQHVKGNAETDDYAADADTVKLGWAKAWYPTAVTTDGGAATVAKEKATTRDKDGKNADNNATEDANRGQKYYTPMKRAAGAGIRTTWSYDAAVLKAWKVANESPFTKGAAYAWWEKATDLTSAVTDWHAYYATDSNQVKVGEANRLVDVYQNDGSNAAEINTTLTTYKLTFTGTIQDPSQLMACKDDGADWAAEKDGTYDGANTIRSVTENTDDTTDAKGCFTQCETFNQSQFLMATDESMTDWKSAATDRRYCAAISWTNDASGTDKCRMYFMGSNESDSNAKLTLTAVGAAGTENLCVVLPSVHTLKTHYLAVGNAFAAVTDALVDAMVGELNAQAELEKDWLEAWYTQQYWVELYKELGDGTATPPEAPADGSRMKGVADALAKVQENSVGDELTEKFAQDAFDTTDSAKQTAESELVKLIAATAEADASRAELAKRIDRTDAEIAQLQTLVTHTVKNDADEDVTVVGLLNEQADLKDADVQAYGDKATTAENEWTELQGKLSEGVAGDGSDAGDIVKTLAEAKKAFEGAQETERLKQEELDKALENLGNLATLRAAVESKTGLWDIQQQKLAQFQEALEDAEKEKEDGEKKVQAAILACQIAAFDKYRTTLEEQMNQRAEDLGKIKKLLEAQEEARPKAGTQGARCEKALSNGTMRPRRDETTCEENLCCAAARVWMDAGAGEGAGDAAWRVIESCQPIEGSGGAGSYEYQPPRAPMATEMPPTVAYPYMCIEGAKQLAAAASALAAAVYMLA